MFTTTIGTPVDHWAMQRDLKRVTARAGIGHWQARELRHSTVSLLSAPGVPLEQVADVTGHATTRMTGDVYRHSVRPAVAAARTTMDLQFASDDPEHRGRADGSAGRVAPCLAPCSEHPATRTTRKPALPRENAGGP